MKAARFDYLRPDSLQQAVTALGPGIAQEIGRRLVADFAANFNARLTGKPLDRQPTSELNLGRLLRLWIGDRLRRLFGRG
jgi:hypothetical protein